MEPRFLYRESERFAFLARRARKGRSKARPRRKAKSSKRRVKSTFNTDEAKTEAQDEDEKFTYSKTFNLKQEE